jgi:hypothetical protein
LLKAAINRLLYLSTAYPSKWINGIDEFLVSHKFYFNTNLIWLKEKINEARGLINTHSTRESMISKWSMVMGYKSSVESSTHGTKDQILCQAILNRFIKYSHN